MTHHLVTAPDQTRAVDSIAERYVEECAARYPELATSLGLPGSDHLWSDYSVDGMADHIAHVRKTIVELHGARPCDQRENVAKESMLERLGLEDELYDAHVTTSRVSVAVGTAQQILSILDLMPTATAEAWHNIATRLRTIGDPLQQTRRRLLAEADAGNISAVRQVTGTADQIKDWCGETGSDDYFAGMRDRVPAEMPETVHRAVGAAADSAREQFAAFGRFLTDELAPLAPSLDAVGAERYALNSRESLGATIDLEETYAWGWDELRRIQDDQRTIARELVGSDDIAQACAALDADDARRIHGAENFRDWMQRLADQAVEELAGKHFDIPDPIKKIDCCLAPTHEGAIYYRPPTEDFSRPGAMWWAVPEGIEDFHTWKEVTVVYHEGVPGHHLQIAQNAYRKDLLNRWQRQLCFVAGHGEGWALYAERLMDDLGYLDDPGDKMGMLDSQAFRAIRVIIDIGMHLQLKIPADNAWGFRPGERWTPAAGFEFLTANCSLDEQTLRFELDRYLGWPGQAPSYKIGERIWLAAREEARARKGADFDLRRFHAAALNLGPLGLDPLRRALARL
ncbi:MAG TPA: DUF885 domain-containing protein [Propionibacteriaceae bacterium]|nr:DUF885 domain-containing protein [Propionibacteriaceae bacterium]